jgi:hypothetical protein
MVTRQLPDLEATNQERHEWESFLALHALLDVSAVDVALYRRCLRGSVALGVAETC